MTDSQIRDEIRRELEASYKEELMRQKLKDEIRREIEEELREQIRDDFLNNYDETEYIYLLQEREFVINNLPIYKIGRTCNMVNRLKNYPKNSFLILLFPVLKKNKVEEIIKKEFIENFEQRREIGIEYFQGNKKEMIIKILNIIKIQDKYTSGKRELSEKQKIALQKARDAKKAKKMKQSK